MNHRNTINWTELLKRSGVTKDIFGETNRMSEDTKHTSEKAPSPHNRRVIVGISGGVDSAVAALLLRQQGYEVIGVRLDMWSEDAEASALASRDARAVCDHLGIPFIELDMRDIFHDEVVAYFIREYHAGRTPNPCVHCNRTTKFRALLAVADHLGAAHIATGHYARVVYNEASGRFELRSPSALAKSQTYMLGKLSQEQLSRIVMPLADMESKDRVREIAAQHGIPVSQKKDSQEICFIKDDYISFLRRMNVAFTEGEFLLDGKAAGVHSGIECYTIGQRKGLGAFGRPVFVVDIDPEHRTVVLGDNFDLMSRYLCADEVNYVGLSPAGGEIRCTAKIRYAAKESPCTLRTLPDGKVEVFFDEPQRAITRGQTVVFYDGDSLLAAATIVATREPEVPGEVRTPDSFIESSQHCNPEESQHRKEEETV